MTKIVIQSFKFGQNRSNKFSKCGKNAKQAELLKVVSLDFLENDQLIREIKADYDFIREKLITSGFDSLTGKDGKWIQARTKGAGHGSKTRAFYARKGLIKKLFEMAI